jgi:hypothetical protein
MEREDRRRTKKKCALRLRREIQAGNRAKGTSTLKFWKGKTRETTTDRRKRDKVLPHLASVCAAETEGWIIPGIEPELQTDRFS